MSIPQQILIVEDHPYMRFGLTTALQQAGYIVHEADNQQAAWDLANHLELAGAVVDLNIPGEAGETKKTPKNGLRLGKRLKEDYPALGIVFHTVHTELLPEFTEMVVHGMRGLAYLSKDTPRESLLKALNRTMDGDLVIEASFLANGNPLLDAYRSRITAEEEPVLNYICGLLIRQAKGEKILTHQEYEMLKLIVSGQSQKGIAEKLTITIPTVQTHTKNIYTKYGLNEIPDTLRQNVLLVKAFTLFQLGFGGE